MDQRLRSVEEIRATLDLPLISTKSIEIGELSLRGLRGTAVNLADGSMVVAGGVESMSRTPMGSSLANGGNPYGESFKARYDKTPNQGVGAEMIAA